jgi:CheY-like chemotaxis protein
LARKILLADDSVTAQNMGRKILTEAGYEVITVNNGSAALKKIAELKPDMIILDVYMPGYGGLEVCHRLKENDETARIPVLLTVGKLEPFKAEEARRVRADMHIVKPFEANELLTALAKLEDRIVAQSDMPKKGRFAASGIAEPAAESFGDEQSGWKSRLIAPRKKAKGAEKVEKIEKVEAKQAEAAPVEYSSESDTLNTTDWRSLIKADLVEDGSHAAISEAIAAGSSTVLEKMEKGSDAVIADSQEEEKDQEVSDALNSLTPATMANAHGDSNHSATGPRWVAQSTPLNDQESTSLLEHEMERAYASLTVADGPTVSFALGPLDAMSFSSSPSEIQEPVAPISEVAKAPVEEVKAEEHKAEEPVTAAVVADVPVESVSQISPESEPKHPQQMESSTENAGGLWLSSPAPYVEDAVSSQIVEPEKPEAAFAAAASSGAASVSAVASSVITPDANVDQPLVMSAEELASEAGDAEEISSMVDTMLAELKPKLMKEIAKKMGKEKR